MLTRHKALLKFSKTAVKVFSMSTTTTSQPLQHPKVGVGVILLRHLKSRPRPEVLLIRRGKPPSLGKWSFAGGSLELGETLLECAIREALEETGLHLRCLPPEKLPPGNYPATYYRDLRHPAVFTAVDVIDRDPSNHSIRFHYAVVEVAALPLRYSDVAVAADDADEVRWVDVQELRSLPDIVPNAVAVVDEALERFTVPQEE